MLSSRFAETMAGAFILIAMIALLVLAMKVSGMTQLFQPKSYHVMASFDEVGQLKVRSPVKIAGVVIGEVNAIQLDTTTFKANVTMRIDKNYDHIPSDSSASILTSGLLGDSYIAVTPMYSASPLVEGSQIKDTHSAMILEKLIGQFMFKMNKSVNTSQTSDTGVSS